MTAAVMVLVAGAAGTAATAFDPKLEMWAPLFVSLAPILAYMLWPVRETTASARDIVERKAA
jgi:hypothetical protein